jgi:hypothetical protein
VLLGALFLLPSVARADDGLTAPPVAVMSVTAAPAVVDARLAQVDVLVSAVLPSAAPDALVTAQLDGTSPEVLLTPPVGGADWTGVLTVPEGAAHGVRGVTIRVSGMATHVDDVVSVADSVPAPLDTLTAQSVPFDPTVLALAWEVPTPDGTTPAERVLVRTETLDSSGVLQLVTEQTVDVVAGSLLVGGAVPLTHYRVTAAAISPIGTGPEVVRELTTGAPLRAPGRPLSVSAVAGDGMVTARWAAPTDDGGVPVLAYRVSSSPTGEPVWVAADVRELKLAPRANGVATSVSVMAVNAIGQGPESVRSASVVPRHPARMTVATAASSRVVYGTQSVVAALMRDLNGVAQAGRRVDLQARLGGTTTWRTVTSGTTGSDGRVTLRAGLGGTSALRLHHPADAVAASDVTAGTVVVAARVSSALSRLALRQHQVLTVSGSVAPTRAAGGAVALQRWTSNGWTTVTKGWIGSYSRFALRWAPPSVGTVTLRVVVPATATLATGVGANLRLRVDRESTADIAAGVLRDGSITEATSHESGVADRATARWNLVDLAAGRLAHRSSYQNAPGGYTGVDRRLLATIRSLGVHHSLTVAEVAGGSHAVGSAHYSGRALDVSVVDGRHVGAGANYSVVVSTCRAYGATHVYSPSYDPYGGHGNHVHCDWS